MVITMVVIAVIIFFAVAFVIMAAIAATVVVMSMISVPVVSVSMGFRSMISVPVSMDFASMVVVSVIFVLTVVAPAVVIVIFRSGVVLTAFFAAFLIALMRAVCHFMTMVLMLSELMMLRIVTDCIRMVIFVAIDPRPLPGSVVDENHATVPRDPVVTPAPGTEGNSHGNAKTEADCRSNNEARTRTRIDNDRIVVRNHDVVRPRRQDGDIRTAGHDDLRTAAQISIVARALPHSLHRIHHFLLLAQKRIAYIFSPAHVRSHHVQDIGKGQQRLHRRVPGQLVAFNGCGQLAASEIVVLICPCGCVGNVVGKRGRRQYLRQQWIRVQRYA